MNLALCAPCLTIGLATTLCSARVHADIRLPAVFSDHAVVQADRPLPVWGLATPEKEVVVSLGNAATSARANAEGRWRVTLPPMAASFTPATLTVSSEGETVEVKDILVGEVWICGGQSNMEWPVSAAANPEAEAARASGQAIRLIKAPHAVSPDEAFTINAQWELASPETVMNWSAVGYEFALDIARTRTTPVGLLSVNWGGTRIEPWIDEGALSRCPLTQDAIAASQAAVEAKRAAAPKGGDGSPGDAEWHGLAPHSPGALWNGMLAPFAPYAVRGALWYQGEANESEAKAYAVLLPTLIDAWKDRFECPDMAFGIVQLAAFRSESEEPSQGKWPWIRAAQDQTARTVPGAFQVVTIDIGDANDIHPRNKRAVGERLAKASLPIAYAQRTPCAMSPVATRVRLIGSPGKSLAVQVTCSDAASLTTRDGGAPRGFALAGKDGVFHWANATISGSQITISCAEVPLPLGVVYGWQDNPSRANVVNECGLPLAPFRFEMAPPESAPAATTKN